MSGQGRPLTFRKTCRRYNDPGHAHALTFSCFGRQPFLRGDRARQWFVDCLAMARAKHAFGLWAYVIMPEHVHLRNLFSPREIAEKINYIHENPVRRGLVETPEDWLWSSARYYFAGSDGILPPDIESLPDIESRDGRACPR